MALFPSSTQTAGTYSCGSILGSSYSPDPYLHKLHPYHWRLLLCQLTCPLHTSDLTPTFVAYSAAKVKKSLKHITFSDYSLIPRTNGPENEARSVTNLNIRWISDMKLDQAIKTWPSVTLVLQAAKPEVKAAGYGLHVQWGCDVGSQWSAFNMFWDHISARALSI